MKYKTEIHPFRNTCSKYKEKVVLSVGQGIPGTEEFKKMTIDNAYRNEVFCFILFVSDMPFAFNFCPVYDKNIMFNNHIVYNPLYSKYSSRTALQYKIIVYIFTNTKIAFYDLCTGEDQHKDIFTNGFRLCENIYFFPLNLKYLFLVYTKVGFDQTTSFSKLILKHFTLKDKIKKNMRKNA